MSIRCAGVCGRAIGDSMKAVERSSLPEEDVCSKVNQLESTLTVTSFEPDMGSGGCAPRNGGTGCSLDCGGFRRFGCEFFELRRTVGLLGSWVVRSKAVQSTAVQRTSPTIRVKPVRSRTDSAPQAPRFMLLKLPRMAIPCSTSVLKKSRAQKFNKLHSLLILALGAFAAFSLFHALMLPLMWNFTSYGSPPVHP